MQTCQFQCFRIWLLQDVQLQVVCKRTILQWNSSAYDEMGPQTSQRFLGPMGSHLFLGMLRLLDFHFLQVNNLFRLQEALFKFFKLYNHIAIIITHKCLTASFPFLHYPFCDLHLSFFFFDLHLRYHTKWRLFSLEIAVYLLSFACNRLSWA